MAADAVPSLNAAGPLASFGAACDLGYAGRISNRVVDAIGDLAGGVRLYSPESAADGAEHAGSSPADRATEG